MTERRPMSRARYELLEKLYNTVKRQRASQREWNKTQKPKALRDARQASPEIDRLLRALRDDRGQETLFDT